MLKAIPHGADDVGFRDGSPVNRLSIVLHTHMPYVEGFGTWPFGEEWLWEAIATSYLPLLDALDADPGRVTVSITPVLADQLEAPGALERCLAFLRDVRTASHALDLAEDPEPAVAAALERSAAEYAAAADALERRGDLLAAFAPHVGWTSAATHAVLPLLATDAGVRLQVETGVEAFRARFGAWNGGFWLPECAHAPWLDELLAEAGVHATCVDWTDVLGAGPHRPRRSDAGILLVPLDRPAIDLVWDPSGYPAHAAYRDSHRLTARDHRPWANDGAPYDADRAAERADADARDFLGRLRGDSVVAFDTELLGHFWHEGVTWLRAVLEHADAAGVELVPLDAALDDARPAPPAAPTSWGAGRDLRTWSAPGAGGAAWAQRAAELAALAAARSGIPARALRELLALQSSDWAFLIDRGTAGDYPRERVEGHRAAFAAALAGEAEPELRNLAPRLAQWAFLQP
jgi:1,4-alpha-glucan branching enzyme